MHLWEYSAICGNPTFQQSLFNIPRHDRNTPIPFNIESFHSSGFGFFPIISQKNIKMASELEHRFPSVNSRNLTLELNTWVLMDIS